MKQAGKIVVMFISLFVLSAIFWFINLENGGEGISAIGLFITIGFSWFISYSKWANDNIWNIKTRKPNNTPNTSSEKVVEPIDVKETPKEVNENLNPNNDNTLLYVIIGILVIILIAVVTSPEFQQTSSDKRETIEREKIPREKIKRETITRKEIETNPVQVEQRVKPKPKPKPKSAWFRTINESNDPFVEDYAYSYGVIKNKSSIKPMIKIKRGDAGLAAYDFYLSGLELNIPDFLRKNNITQSCDGCGMELAFKIAFSPNDGRIWGAGKGLYYTIGYYSSVYGLIEANWDQHLKSLSEKEHEFRLQKGHPRISPTTYYDHNSTSSFVQQIKTKNKMFIIPVLFIKKDTRGTRFEKTFDTIEFDLRGSTNALSSYERSYDPYSGFFVEWGWD